MPRANSVLKLFLLVFILVVLTYPTSAQTMLTADGKTNTYTLITNALAPGATPYEVPDTCDPANTPHIRQAFDTDRGHYVFQFLIHMISADLVKEPVDCDPSTHDVDRQRNEIKTYNSSPAALKANPGETVTYRWKFKLPGGFQASPNFTHLHQIKAVNGNDSNPVITYTAEISGSTPQFQLKNYSDSGTLTTWKAVNLSSFLGEWVEAYEKITFNTSIGVANGSYSVTIKRVRDGYTLLSYTNNAVDLLRSNPDPANPTFYRPKWGIYRSVANSSYLRDETVLFDHFCLAKGSTDCPTYTETSDFGISTTPSSQAILVGAGAGFTTSITPGNGFTGNVALTVTGLPSGATSSFSPTSIAGGSGSSTLTVNTSSVTTPGTYTVTITGTSGSLVHKATVSLTVNPVPPAPVASSQATTTAFNTPVSITLAATNNPTSWSYTQPTNGIVSGTAPNLIYTPAPAFVGSDSFTFTATNAGGTSASATVSVTVNLPPAPVASGQNLTTLVNTSLAITLSATNNPTTWSYNQAAHGIVSGTAPNLTYTPNTDYVGADSFTFSASNAGGTGNTATLSISVSGTAPAPTPDPGSHSLVISQFYLGNGSATYSPYADSFVELFNAGSQPVDLQNWTFNYQSGTSTSSLGDTTKQWIGSADTGGTCATTGCQVAYSAAFTASNCTPKQAGQLTAHCVLNPGQYMLIKTKSSSASGSKGQTVPLPYDLDLTTQADPVFLNSGGTANILSLSGTQGKIALVNGRASASACNFSADKLWGNRPLPTSFSPIAVDYVGYSGYDSTGGGTTWIPNCWEGSSATLPSWDPGAISPLWNSTGSTDYSNGPVDLMHSNLKNKATFVRTTGFAGPHNPTSSASGTSFTVTPNPCGDTDNNAANFGPINVGDPGTAQNTWILHNSQQVYDPVNRARAYTPSPCTGLSSVPPLVSVTATPAVIDQAAGNTVNVNVIIRVTPSTQPVATLFKLAGSSATSGIVGAAFPSSSSWTDAGWDANGRHIFTTIATVPADVVGSFTVTASATDDAYRIGSGSATITVQSVVLPPISVSSAASVPFNTPTIITLNASDPASRPLTYTVTSGPSHGRLNAAAGSDIQLTYTPNTGYTGPDSFIYKVNNGTSDSSVATVTITVNAPPVPVATGQSLTTSFETDLPITLSATNTPTSYSAGMPANGSLACSGANCTYTPNAGFVGLDSFTFTATNAGGTSDPATVSIIVNAPPKPVADNQTITASPGVATAILLTASGSPTSFAAGAPSHGTLNCTAAACTYTSNSGYLGPDSFTFTATNAGGTSDPATVSINVTDPVASTLISPAPATVLSGDSAIFTWTAGSLVDHYMLFVGTSVGADDVYYSGPVTNSSANVIGLRSTDGSIYVRLYSWIPSLKGWQYNDYVFAYNAPRAATLTAPAAGTALSGYSATFTWTPGTLVTKYMLFVGTQPGTPDDFYSGDTTATSLSVNGLRSTDGNIYVRLYSWFDNGWHYNDYVFSYTPPVQPAAATLTAPAGPIITGDTAEFTWTAGTAIDHYMLCVATQPGGTDNYYSGPTTSRDIVVTGIRSTDGNVYVRLYSWATDHWLWNDYVFQKH